jgi:hypothetical protein
VARPLSATDLLDLWEQGVGRLPAEQGLLLLRAAHPEMPAADLLRLPIGQRDTELMRLRENTFGSSITGLASCPNCDEQVEIGFALEDLFMAHAGHTEPSTLQIGADPERFSIAGFDLAFRLPGTADLLNMPPDPASARLALLDACLVEVCRDGDPVRTADLPEQVVQNLIARMEKSDPLANVTLPLTCPACGNQWELVFDIVTFFWSEINALAQRLLHEVHVLASVYGWSEAEILALSAWRRQRYLELVGA